MYLRLPSETAEEQEYVKYLDSRGYRESLLKALDKLNNMKLNSHALDWLKMSEKALRKWEVRRGRQDSFPFVAGVVLASAVWILAGWFLL